jgi:hypothetical protein
MAEITRLYTEDEVHDLVVLGRLEEINLFAEQAQEQGFSNDPKIIGYLMARTLLLGMQLGVEREHEDER